MPEPQRPGNDKADIIISEPVTVRTVIYMTERLKRALMQTFYMFYVPMLVSG